jgi:hypothetical protein
LKLDLDFQNLNQADTNSNFKKAAPNSKASPYKGSRGKELKAKLRFMKHSMDAMAALVDEYMDGGSHDDTLQGGVDSVKSPPQHSMAASFDNGRVRKRQGESRIKSV